MERASGQLFSPRFRRWWLKACCPYAQPDGTLLATGADDGVGRIWTPSGDLLQVLSMHQKAVHSLQWTPNGASLVTGSLDNSVCLWDLNLGKVKQQWATHQNSQTSLELDVFDDQTFVTCSNDKIIHRQSSERDTRDGADGETVLAYGKPHPVHRFRGHTDDVNTVKFNPSKTLLASGSDDHTVRAWSLAGVAPGVPTLEGDDGDAADGPADVGGGGGGGGKARLARRGGSVELKHGSDVVCLAWSRKNPAWLVSYVFRSSTLSVRRRLKAVCTCRGGSDGVVKMWDIETGATCVSLLRRHD